MLTLDEPVAIKMNNKKCSILPCGIYYVPRCHALKGLVRGRIYAIMYYGNATSRIPLKEEYYLPVGATSQSIKCYITP